MQDTRNPYAAPGAHVEQYVEIDAKADRGTRLGATIVDTILYGLCWGPGYFQLMLATEAEPVTYGAVGTAISILAALAGVALFVYNLWLLHAHGQTVAKKMLNIRIVRTGGQRASLARLFWLRIFVPSLIGAIPLIGPFFSLCNALAIFGSQKRCLHDLIADTIVVVA